MEELRMLMENYWIDRGKDKAAYARVRRESGKFREFITERLGWKLIINERIIKIEKVPSMASPSMGITEFQTALDYILLCAVLVFLEDQGENGQFLLTELVENVEIQVREVYPVDWTRFADRKALVRVLKYLENKGMLLAYEKQGGDFGSNEGGQVLYENTGLSRYFATTFGRSMEECRTSEDFEANPWTDLDTDRGALRTHRVYRNLVTRPAIYWTEATDPDAIYLKNQRSSITAQITGHLGGTLHIHRNAAAVMLDDGEAWGDTLPNGTALSGCLLLFCGDIREKLGSGTLEDSRERFRLSQRTFSTWALESRQRHGSGYSKGLREMGEEAFAEGLLAEMERWCLAAPDGEDVILLPMAGKLKGEYPVDFTETPFDGTQSGGKVKAGRKKAEEAEDE